MNWLAHVLLSEPSPAFQVGNLLPDIIPPAEVSALDLEFRRGAACHLVIDRFTDAHPVVRRSVQRLDSGFRRFGGIVVDLFYDHFLASNWDRFSPVPLGEFTAQVYGGFVQCEPGLPPAAAMRLSQIRTRDLLGSYAELSGVRRALERLGKRLRRPVPLVDTLAQLEAQYTDFRADFEEFFPALREHVAGYLAAEGQVPVEGPC